MAKNKEDEVVYLTPILGGHRRRRVPTITETKEMLRLAKAAVGNLELALQVSPEDRRRACSIAASACDDVHRKFEATIWEKVVS